MTLRDALARIAILNGGAAGVELPADRAALYRPAAAELRRAGFDVPPLRGRWDEAYDRAEVRTVPTEIRALESGRVAGRGIPYGVESEEMGFGVEIIEPGAFVKSIEIREVHAAYNHSRDRVPLGSTDSGTLRLDNRGDGLWFDLDLPESAADVRESLQRKDLRYMSFGFRAIRDHWEQRDTGETTRRVMEAELFELSITPDPAYRQTSAALRRLETWTAEGLTEERAREILSESTGTGLGPDLAQRRIDIAELETF